jgi:lysophospholipase L1-like esterase
LERHKNFKEWTPNPDLPNILILGDSNTVGYIIPLRRLLKDKANIYYPIQKNGGPNNCANTAYGLENIERFLGDTQWDVIHFNWGLHDCSRLRVENGKIIVDNVNGEWKIPPEEYTQNLEKIIERLKKTKAKLIWTNSSVVNKGTHPVRVGDEVIYNALAKKVIEKEGIPTNDIYDLTKDFKPEQFRALGNIHFSEEGFAIIAGQVAKVLLKALDEKH